MTTIKVTDEAAKMIAVFRNCNDLEGYKSSLCDAFTAASIFCIDEDFSRESTHVLWAINRYSELINELAKTE